jgi:hypothetical protein
MSDYRLTVHRGRPHCVAQCEDCGKRWEGFGTTSSDNARAAAKRHAEQTRHTVFVERTAATYFNSKA